MFLRGIHQLALLIFVSSIVLFSETDETNTLHRPFFERVLKLQTMNWYTNSTSELIQKKYPGSWVDQTPKNKVRYFFVPDHESKRQFLAFRWTANLMNAWVDLNFRRVYDPTLDTWVHNGVNLAAKEVMGRLLGRLIPEYDLVITGHSMGGSIALVLAMHMVKADYPLSQVVTFGQFRITNRAGTMKWKDLPYIRVAAEKDYVTWLPPTWLTGYHHFGKNLKLIGDTQYRFLVPGEANMLDNLAGSHPEIVIETWERVRQEANPGLESPLPEIQSVWGPGHDLDNYIRKLAVIAAGFPEAEMARK